MFIVKYIFRFGGKKLITNIFPAAICTFIVYNQSSHVVLKLLFAFPLISLAV